MFLGHFGFALAAKQAAPKTSFGTLVQAAQFADVQWPLFLLLGWEQVRIAPGTTRVTPSISSLIPICRAWRHK